MATRHITQDGARATLAAVAIAKNEAGNISGLIANLEPLVDQIVIVDDCSTDGTADIANRPGGRVTVVTRAMELGEGFAGQRNVGIAAATADWLIHMDADERLTPELAAEMRAAISSTDLNGFRYRRLNHFLQRPMRHGGWTSWNRPQLARRGRHRFEGRVHETCVIDGGDAATGQLDGIMLHLNEATFEERLSKSAKYVEMTANDYSGSADFGGGRIFARTVIAFLKRYVVQRGFLDGTPGLISALHSATAEFRALALVWDRRTRVSRGDFEERLATEWGLRGCTGKRSAP